MMSNISKITLIQTRKEESRLQFVKGIKNLTGFGLKDSKDIGDTINFGFVEGNLSKVVVDISGVSDKRESIREFVKHVREFCTGEYIVEDLVTERQGKLLSIGIGDRTDYIDYMSNIITYLDRDKIVEFFKDTMSSLSDEEIKDLYVKMGDKVK